MTQLSVVQTLGILGFGLMAPEELIRYVFVLLNNA